tara:strand:- start:5949 stop:6224 length:276 start_codon:yes stop_codon:yes gene_type:complete
MITEIKTMDEVVQKLETLVVPDNAELIDDVFYVWKTRYGLYTTMTKEGRKMMTGATKEGVTTMTRWHLKCEQEGTLHLYTTVVNSSSTVDL